MIASSKGVHNNLFEQERYQENDMQHTMSGTFVVRRAGETLTVTHYFHFNKHLRFINGYLQDTVIGFLLFDLIHTTCIFHQILVHIDLFGQYWSCT